MLKVTRVICSGPDPAASAYRSCGISAKGSSSLSLAVPFLVLHRFVATSDAARRAISRRLDRYLLSTYRGIAVPALPRLEDYNRSSLAKMGKVRHINGMTCMAAMPPSLHDSHDLAGTLESFCKTYNLQNNLLRFLIANSHTVERLSC